MAKILGRHDRRRNSLILGDVVNVERLLTSQRVVDRVKARLIGDGLNNRLKSIDELLVVVAIVGHR